MSVSTLLRRLDSAHAPTAIQASSSAHAVGLSHVWSVSIHANIAAPVVQLYAPNAHVPTPTIRCHLAHVGLAKDFLQNPASVWTATSAHTVAPILP